MYDVRTEEREDGIKKLELPHSFGCDVAVVCNARCCVRLRVFLSCCRSGPPCSPRLRAKRRTKRQRRLSSQYSRNSSTVFVILRVLLTNGARVLRVLLANGARSPPPRSPCQQRSTGPPRSRFGVLRLPCRGWAHPATLWARPPGARCASCPTSRRWKRRRSSRCRPPLVLARACRLARTRRPSVAESVVVRVRHGGQ